MINDLVDLKRNLNLQVNWSWFEVTHDSTQNCEGSNQDQQP